MTKIANKKPRISHSLATKEIQGSSSAKADDHSERITRFGNLKHRAKKQENYLWTLVDYEKPTDESQKAIKAASKLQDCGNYLFFKNYYTIDQIRLTKFNACREHLLCPFCAGIRASKSVQKYTERIYQVLKENKKLKPVLITLTVKNGENLSERANHLMTSFRTLLDRRRDALKKGRGYNEFCKVNGAMYSYENTFNEKTGEWHPHVHMFALLDDWIDQDSLSKTWHDITGDSMIVDIRRVQRKKGHGIAKAAAEVCKYALKFGDLSVENTWHAFKVLKGKRLTGSIGCLWGVKLDDSMLDDPVTDDLPYLEMLYKFTYGRGRKSFYDLVMVRKIDPEQKPRLIEEEVRATEIIKVVDAVDQPIERDVAFRERSSARFKRKKEHWQLPPRTRFKTYKKIRQWDGFLYHFDLIEFLIRWLENKYETV